MGNNQSHTPGSPRSGGNGSPNEGTGSTSRAANLSGIIFNRDRSGSSASFGSFAGGRNRDKDKGDAANTPQTPPGLIDGGHLHPQGTYAQRNPDYNHGIVKGLIIEKKLAPFYRGLEDYEEDWEDEDVIKSLRSLRAGQGQPALADLPPLTKVADKERREARAYKGAAECPICFLVSPDANDVKAMSYRPFSITPQISTPQDVASSRSAQSVSCKSNERKPRSRISSPSRPHVRTAWNQILVSSMKSRR
jgi:hypothetical protein